MVIKANDIYEKIAERDFFDILIKNMKEHKENMNTEINSSLTVQASQSITQITKKKKKTS